MSSQEDYKIEINGKEFEVGLDKDYEFNINNELYKIKIKQKDTLLYTDDAFSFKFLKDHKVAKTSIDQGIEQLMLMTAEGSGFIIQKYSTINPTMLNEIMLSEVTKESINYGYTMERQEYERTLVSGEKIKVIKAILTYKDEINIYEIATSGKKDSGILILTMLMEDLENSVGKSLINLTWNTLDIK
ncbi:hypothetical protein JJL45_02680 [Tamlana sp. s12]|uniref:hypothetical protein n=1 Tax=Tamlana sp. s12 TaxID=1630406 RepID=UPI0007FB85D4|nr:hypothetical protein [Tamlana sp. s12]OBQ52012.1 hypothetical protein VQ01_14875 [Tamlana sp. s12]QQY82916.1 hypothetical protein JJL45_02680 [Tamlana sp. s12]